MFHKKRISISFIFQAFMFFFPRLFVGPLRPRRAGPPGGRLCCAAARISSCKALLPPVDELDESVRFSWSVFTLSMSSSGSSNSKSSPSPWKMPPKSSSSPNTISSSNSDSSLSDCSRTINNLLDYGVKCMYFSLTNDANPLPY